MGSKRQNERSAGSLGGGVGGFDVRIIAMRHALR